jgi:2-C-methyl-D-erythritol 2,4-cyclodiphosphate synthase
MPYRIGHGYDLHRLQGAPPGGKLVLGGVTVSTSLAPVAHSDGDVVLHALTDALLGTIQAGDIGDAFPNTDPRWRNAESKIFVEHALTRVRAAGYEVVNADILIQAERPKLGAHKAEIAARVSALLGGPVNVKAGTNEGCDAIGEGLAIAATVVVLVAKSSDPT